MLGRLEPMLVRIDDRLRLLEGDVARIEERLNHVTAVMATKEDLARVAGSLRAELAIKPSRGSMRTMTIALVGLIVAPMGAGAAYLPLVQHALVRQSDIALSGGSLAIKLLV